MFSTFLVQCVNNAISAFLHYDNPYSLPTNQIRAFFEVKAEIDSSKDSFESVLAKHNMSAAEFFELYNFIEPPASIYQPHQSEDPSLLLIDSIAAKTEPKTPRGNRKSRLVLGVVKNLPLEYQRYYFNRHVLQLGPTEAGREMGLSRHKSDFFEKNLKNSVRVGLSTIAEFSHLFDKDDATSTKIPALVKKYQAIKKMEAMLQTEDGQAKFAGLTDAERKYLRFYMDHYSMNAKSIGENFGVSRSLIQVRVSSAFRKMGIELVQKVSRAQHR